MICRTCLQRATALGRRSIIHRAPTSRTFAATAAPRQAAAGDATTATKDGDEAAASGRSSCIAGTVLTGLNYFKGKADPVALPDNEYPEWLWSCIDVQKKAASDDDPDAGDLFCRFSFIPPPRLLSPVFLPALPPSLSFVVCSSVPPPLLPLC